MNQSQFHHYSVHIMIDMETAATSSDAAVLQFAAYQFYGMGTGAEFNSYISPDSNTDYKRKFDPQTLAWWDKQDRDLRNKVFSGTSYLDNTISNFNAGLTGIPKENIYLWSNGADFDLMILKDIYEESLGWKYPFDFRNHRCFRTLKSLWPGEPPKFEGQKHDALCDARHQGQWAVKILKNLGVIE